jgi:hypothetical protein
MQTVTFEPCAEDLLAANRLIFKIVLKTKRTQYGFLTGGLIAGALCALASWIWSFDTPLRFAAIGVIYWIFFITVVFGAVYLRLPRQSRTVYVQQKSLHGPSTVEWSDIGITFKSERGQSSFAWDDFTRIEVGDDVVVLRQSDALSNFIPRRALSAEQVKDIARR